MEPAKLELLHRKPAGGFDVQPVALAGTAATALAIGDLEGDGELDIAVADAAASTAVTLVKTAFGYTATTPSATGATPNSIAIADFDNDGTADIATANATGVTVLLHGIDGQGPTVEPRGVFCAPDGHRVALTASACIRLRARG